MVTAAAAREFEGHVIALGDWGARVKADVECFVEGHAIGNAFLYTTFADLLVVRKQRHSGSRERFVGIRFVDSFERYLTAGKFCFPM